MKPSTRQALLVVVAVAWAVLGVVNLVKGRTPLGLVYIGLGVVVGVMAVAAARARRPR